MNARRTLRPRGKGSKDFWLYPNYTGNKPLLTYEEAEQIRRFWHAQRRALGNTNNCLKKWQRAEGAITLHELAKRTNLPSRLLSMIVNGKSYRHPRLTDTYGEVSYQLWVHGFTPESIGEFTGVSGSTIQDWRSEFGWVKRFLKEWDDDEGDVRVRGAYRRVRLLRRWGAHHGDAAAPVLSEVRRRGAA